jgi:hypothetical protein
MIVAKMVMIKLSYGSKVQNHNGSYEVERTVYKKTDFSSHLTNNNGSLLPGRGHLGQLSLGTVSLNHLGGKTGILRQRKELLNILGNGPLTCKGMVGS